MSEEISKEIIENLTFLNVFNEEERKYFLKYSYLIDYPKGKALIESSAVCQNVYFVISGVIRVYKMTEEGKEVTLYRVGPGSTCLFTLGCILGKTSIENEALAEVEQGVKLIAIPGDIFKELLTKSVKFLEFILGKFLTTITDLMVLTEEITFHHINQRLANHLLTNMEVNIIETTHEKIANDLGTAREVVSRMLEEFQKSGIVKLSRGKIEIINISKLKQVASL